MPFIKTKIKFQYKKFLFIAVASVFISILFNCNLPAQKDSTLLIYVGDKAYPPYEYLDKNGKPAGFNVELIREIGKVLNKNVQVKLMNWAEARKSIENGNADVLSIFYLPRRAEFFEFGETFTIVNHEIFIRKDSPPINNLTEIGGKEIIIQDLAYVNDYLGITNHNAKLILVNDEPNALKLLSSGKHDCSILGEQVGRYVIRELDLENITTSGPPLLPCEYRLAAKKGNTKLINELNRAFSEIKSKGSYDEIYNKWLTIQESPGIFRFLSEHLVYILGTFLLITLITLLLTVHYKNKVQQASVELKFELVKRTQAESELRSSQQKLAKAQQIARIGNWELDLITNKLSWSEQIFTIFGLPDKFFSTQYEDLFDAIHPEDRKKRILAQAEGLIAKKPFEVEYRIIRSDGEIRHIFTKGEFSFDEKNQPVKIFGTAQDITERKLLEDALKQSEERYRLLFKKNPLPMWVYNSVTFRFLAVNHAAEKIYGYAREEFLKMTIMDIRPAEDVQRLTTYLNTIDDEFEFGGIWRHRKKDGTIINVEIISHQIDFGEEPARLILANDVTEKLNAERMLKESENRLSVIYNSTSDLMYMLSVEPGIQFKLQTVNKAFLKTFNAGIDEFNNQYVDQIAKLNTTSLKNKLMKVVESKSIVSFEENILINDDQLTFENTLYPLIDDNGNCIFIIGSSRNITERIKAQEALKISKDQLRELAANLQNIREEERTAIAREIHDELGQVLTYLKINLTLIGKSFSSEENLFSKDDFQSDIQGMIEIIDKAVKRIRKLITELRPEVLDNFGLIPALEWQVQEFKEKTGINCSFTKNISEIDIDKQVSVAVFRIFQEALTNIVKHAKATEVEVKLNYEKSKLSMEICDNGIGFSETKIQSKKTFGIMGMRERTIILGGNFNIENNAGTGTKLMIDIPLNGST